MQSRPAASRSRDLIFAKTREGYDLPVIDVTHPRFAVPEDPNGARALHDAFVASERRRRHIPAFILRLLLRSAAKKSRLVRTLSRSNAGFLDGKYTAFGEVTSGMDVVDKIKAGTQENNGAVTNPDKIVSIRMAGAK